MHNNNNFLDIVSAVDIQEKNYISIAPEIVQTSNFKFKTYQNFLEASKDEKNNYVYSRGGNPTTKLLEKMLAELEKGEKCKVFGSGMGAISASLLSVLESGDHFIMVNTIYGEAYSFAKYLEKFDISLTKVNINKPNELKEYIQSNTKLIYIESPSHQKCQLLDIEEIAALAKRNDILTFMDSTWASPYFQNPLSYGIDLSIHSLSKYIGGHSDVLGGAIIGSTNLVDKIFDNGHQFLGSVISPASSWLCIRGLRTLPVRMNYLSNSVKKFLDAIKNDSRIEKIYHPYVSDKYQSSLAKKYLTGYGSLLSLELSNDSFEKLIQFVDELKYFSIGVSWGGFESLVLPSYKGNNINKLNERGLKKSHIRLYIGLENTQTLINDFKSALDKVYGKGENNE